MLKICKTQVEALGLEMVSAFVVHGVSRATVYELAVEADVLRNAGAAQVFGQHFDEAGEHRWARIAPEREAKRVGDGE